jgi:hypothetical protein
MAERRRARRDLNAEERAVLAELADGEWRVPSAFAPRPRFSILGGALQMLLARDLIEQGALDRPRWYANSRWRYRITDQGRAELAPPDRADG